MILYFDTSALFKLYVSEIATAEVKALHEQADLVATALISYAEFQAALARRMREDAAIAAALQQVRQEFVRDWPHFMAVAVNQALVEQAAYLADVFALRGYDSVQLAAARFVQTQVQTSITFACCDERLSRAASVLGMHTPLLPPAMSGFVGIKPS